MESREVPLEELYPEGLPTVRNGSAKAPPANDPALHRHSGLTERESEMRWFTPAVPSPADSLQDAEASLDGVIDTLPNNRGWQEYLRWTYNTRVRPAAQELQAAERAAEAHAAERAERSARQQDDLERKVSALEERRAQVADQLEQAADAYATAMGEAGLASLPDEGPINPKHVQDALHDSAPTIEELAGERGLVPADHGLATFGKQLMEGGAPVVCGIMLAICVGTLTGLIQLIDLRNLDRPTMLVLAVALGTVIVSLIGSLVQTAVATLVQRQEERHHPDGEPPVPTLRAGVFVGFILAACLIFFIAEVTAEGLGLRDLHLQRLVEASRLSGPGAHDPSTQLLPMWIYIIVGTLISGPYIFYKAAKGWKEGERLQRLAWLKHRRLDRVRAMFREEPVQRALANARRTESLSKRLAEVDEQLAAARERLEEAQEPGLSPQMKARLEYATGAAVGEAMRLHGLVEQFVNEVDPLPGSPKRAGAGRKNEERAEPERYSAWSR